MKKIIIVLMLVVILTLTACTADKGGETEAVEAKSTQQWTYKIITQACSYDAGRNDVVCMDPATEEETMLANIIGSQASNGFELDEVVLSARGKGYVQSFIFRKAFAAPAE